MLLTSPQGFPPAPELVRMVVVVAHNGGCPLDSVAVVMSFTEDAEVVTRANNTSAGLAAYFYTNDVRRVWRVSEALQFGMVGVNTGRDCHPHVSFRVSHSFMLRSCRTFQPHPLPTIPLHKRAHVPGDTLLESLVSLFSIFFCGLRDHQFGSGSVWWHQRVWIWARRVEARHQRIPQHQIPRHGYWHLEMMHTAVFGRIRHVLTF